MPWDDLASDPEDHYWEDVELAARERERRLFPHLYRLPKRTIKSWIERKFAQVKPSLMGGGGPPPKHEGLIVFPKIEQKPYTAAYIYPTVSVLVWR